MCAVCHQCIVFPQNDTALNFVLILLQEGVSMFLAEKMVVCMRRALGNVSFYHYDGDQKSTANLSQELGEDVRERRGRGRTMSNASFSDLLPALTAHGDEGASSSSSSSLSTAPPMVIPSLLHELMRYVQAGSSKTGHCTSPTAAAGATADSRADNNLDQQECSSLGSSGTPSEAAQVALAKAIKLGVLCCHMAKAYVEALDMALAEFALCISPFARTYVQNACLKMVDAG
jgi:hypothetical protein